MSAVADTGPINYLVQTGEIDLLHLLYGEVLIPRAVRNELTSSRAPLVVQEWVRSGAAWLTVADISVRDGMALPSSLDPGEREAIVLAQTVGPEILIVDDRAGRREANRLGIPVTGTVGVLRVAAERGLVDLQSAVARLQQTSFYMNPGLLRKLLETG